MSILLGKPHIPISLLSIFRRFPHFSPQTMSTFRGKPHFPPTPPEFTDPPIHLFPKFSIPTIPVGDGGRLPTPRTHVGTRLPATRPLPARAGVSNNLITFGWRYQKRGFQTPNLITFAGHPQKRGSPKNNLSAFGWRYQKPRSPTIPIGVGEDCQPRAHTLAMFSGGGLAMFPPASSPQSCVLSFAF